MSRCLILSMIAAGSFASYLFFDTRIESTITLIAISGYALAAHWAANKFI